MVDVWVGGRLVFGGLRAAGIIFGRLGVRRLSFSASQRFFGKDCSGEWEPFIEGPSMGSSCRRHI